MNKKQMLNEICWTKFHWSWSGWIFCIFTIHQPDENGVQQPNKCHVGSLYPISAGLAGHNEKCAKRACRNKELQNPSVISKFCFFLFLWLQTTLFYILSIDIITINNILWMSDPLITSLVFNTHKRNCILETERSPGTQCTCHGFTMTLVIYQLRWRNNVWQILECIMKTNMMMMMIV